MHEGLIYTNDTCIGCNKCVRICSSFGASVSKSGAEKTTISINGDRCIVCGACVDVCAHGARQYRDDTEAFLRDLRAGEPISVLVAPSFAAKHPESYRYAFGILRNLGVRRILPVSLGADICTWGYIKCLEQGDDVSKISTSCPVVVSYIEHWMSELIDRLMPIKSPLMCLATYCREELNMTEKFAFIGPCIAKRLEIDRYPDLVQYNVTFPRLDELLANEPFVEPSDYDDMEYGLGSYYPAPGGLADNLRWLVSDDLSIRVVSGKQYLYERFERGRRGVFSHDLPYVLVDALNCTEGCIEGTARGIYDSEEIGLAHLGNIRAGSKSTHSDSPWNPSLTPAERLSRLNQRFASLDVSSYRTSFVDQSEKCHVSIPSEAEALNIYKSLHKDDEDARHIDCSACGYETCNEMMIAIHNGFNTRYNCVYFEKEETLLLSRLSYIDQLTGVLNRNALELTSTNLYGPGHSLGLIVADVNGLKHENDTKGHAAGDRLIVTSAKALANEFGRERVFRTGGDEFLVILQDHDYDEIAQGVADVRQHLQSKGVSISLGMAYSPSFEDDFEKIEKLADARMYEDKARYYEQSGTMR